MTTQIKLLPLVTLAVSASQDGDLTVPIAFQNANGGATDLSGIAFGVILRTSTPTPTISLNTAGTAFILNGGSSGNLTLAVPQSFWGRIPAGTYVGDLVATADGATIVVGSMTVVQSPIGGCLITAFTTASRNAATAGSVGYIPGPGWNQYRGDYSNAANYLVNDVAYSAFSSWICTAPTTGNAPAVGSPYWHLIAPGVDPTALIAATASAASSASLANGSAAAAAASASNAAGSANAAQTAATSASTSTASASVSANAAAGSATAAGNSASAAAGSASSAAASAAQAASIAVPRGFISGLTLSNDATTPNSVLDVSAGSAADSAGAVLINLAAFTKSTGGTWAAGSGANGMGNGLTIAASTWYHVFAIVKGGVADVYFDTSVTAANAPSGTTAFRRLGSIKTNSSAQITKFSQNGNEFLWYAVTFDINMGSGFGTTAVLYTLNVPPGVKVNALFGATTGTASNNIYVQSPDQSGTQGTSGLPTGSTGVWSNLSIRTNAVSQVQAYSQVANASFYVITSGWIDTRGSL